MLPITKYFPRHISFTGCKEMFITRSNLNSLIFLVSNESALKICVIFSGQFFKKSQYRNLNFVWFRNQVNIYLRKVNQFMGILINRIWRNSRIPLGGNRVKKSNSFYKFHDVTISYYPRLLSAPC